MNLKTKLAVAALLAASASLAQASTFTYSVVGKFNEPMIPGTAGDTEFHGTFNWNGTTVSNFTGTMNESMQGAWVAGQGNYVNGQSLQDIENNGTYMLALDKQLQQTNNGSLVTASIFKENTTDVYTGGGYNYATSMNGMKFLPANENAYFTLAFTHDGSGNITSLGLQTLATNATLVNAMIYGDCTVGSLMGSGNDMCMAGEPTGSSMMLGTAKSIEIIQGAPVSEVPVPAAAWLFGSALLGLFGVNRRKNVLPA
ncbi:VPLPA-CTERM sorting domain-containing protein [Methylomonas montana]|uniref:VPLPA-CTERM sorting domain-containing protein n=1 Tax=Methylomonas montana TaxID=3058963 RepID=UPI002658021D|nr:VPLPA-CTERM sorting domain-containing protein [Methylomonas montana]WKJ92527.1 VPLPA-CTERM sorting domain-containing protein [Methylomonas montana]